MAHALNFRLIPRCRPFLAALCMAVVSSLGHAAAAAEETEPTVLEVQQHVFLGVIPRGTPPADLISSLAVVIDLRFPYEGVYDELGALRAAGITHINIPTSSHEPQQEQVLALEQALAENADANILIHDSTGFRSAMLWAAHRVHTGVTVDEALKEVAALAPAGELRPKLVAYNDLLAAAEVAADPEP